jgi:hypothetical protein
MKVGYSGTPLPKKLGIRSGCRLLLVDAPELPALEPLPPDTTVETTASTGAFDVIMLFCADLARLRMAFSPLVPLMTVSGGLWACWPKKASGLKTDLSDQVVRAHGLDVGLVDVKVAAIDATWSGLKFVRRRTDR